jgi:hypothetical protein
MKFINNICAISIYTYYLGFFVFITICLYDYQSNPEITVFYLKICYLMVLIGDLTVANAVYWLCGARSARLYNNYFPTPTVASYTLQSSGPTSPAGSSTSGGGGQVLHVYNHSWSKLRHQKYSTV